jgi:hypothetical protein
MSDLTPQKTTPEKSTATNLQPMPVKSEADLPEKPEGCSIHVHGRIEPDLDKIQDRLRIAIFKHYGSVDPVAGATYHPGMPLGESLDVLLAQLEKTTYRLLVVGPHPVAVFSGTPEGSPILAYIPPSERIDFRIERRKP